MPLDLPLEDHESSSLATLACGGGHSGQKVGKGFGVALAVGFLLEEARLDDEQDGKERADVRRGLSLDFVEPLCHRPRDADVHLCHCATSLSWLVKPGCSRTPC